MRWRTRFRAALATGLIGTLLGAAYGWWTLASESSATGGPLRTYGHARGAPDFDDWYWWHAKTRWATWTIASYLQRDSRSVNWGGTSAQRLTAAAARLGALEQWYKEHPGAPRPGSELEWPPGGSGLTPAFFHEHYGYTHAYSFSVGFPCRCLRGIVLSVAVLNKPDDLCVVEGADPGIRAHGDPAIVGTTVAPTSPIYSGLAINIAVFAGAALSTALLCDFSRRTIAMTRTRRSRCPSCSYPRSGLAANAPCPECGRTPPPNQTH